MKFFIDTANLNEIKEAYDLGVLDGVTTNPSLMAKEGIKGADNIRAHYKAICNIVDNNVSAEVIATDFENIIKEGKELAKIDEPATSTLAPFSIEIRAVSGLMPPSTSISSAELFFVFHSRARRTFSI